MGRGLRGTCRGLADERRDRSDKDELAGEEPHLPPCHPPAIHVCPDINMYFPSFLKMEKKQYLPSNCNWASQFYREEDHVNTTNPWDFRAADYICSNSSRSLDTDRVHMYSVPASSIPLRRKRVPCQEGETYEEFDSSKEISKSLQRFSSLSEPNLLLISLRIRSCLQETCCLFPGRNDDMFPLESRHGLERPAMIQSIIALADLHEQAENKAHHPPQTYLLPCHTHSLNVPIHLPK